MRPSIPKEKPPSFTGGFCIACSRMHPRRGGAEASPSTLLVVVFTYNLDGRLSHISDIEDIALAHDLDDRLTTTTPITGWVSGTPVSVSMDAMGNIVNDGTRSFSYDVAGRMVGVSAGAHSATDHVNASVLHVRKVFSGIGATDELAAYDDQRRRIGVYQPDGTGGFTIDEELVYLPGSWRMVATVRGQVLSGADGTAYPILSDNLGSPRTVLDPATGGRRWNWESKEAFGFQAPNENPDNVSTGAFVFDARFPGQFLYAEKGLFHNGFRDYDAKMGRYIESDPLGLEAGQFLQKTIWDTALPSA